MKVWGIVVILIFLVFLGIEVYVYRERVAAVVNNRDALQESLQKARENAARLQAELDYYRNPENLEKELRARFNYRESGERLLILVPEARASTTPSSTTP